MAIDSASGMHSRRTVLGILAAAFAPMMPGLAHGQSQQPIRLNVPFSPGTGPDLLARILSEELRQRWNHPVIVENKPGASGNIGTQAAARTAPDGQNLLVTVNTFVMNASLYPTMPYDPEKDFVPIVEIATGVSGARRSSLARRQHTRGTDRTCPQQTGRDQLCFSRPRHTATSRHGAVQAHGADQPDAHSLFRIGRRGEGSGGRTRLGHVPAGPYRASARRDRANPHPRRGQPEADAAGGKCADARRTRRHRLRCRFVVRRSRAGQYAERDRRSLQCGVQRDTRGAERSSRFSASKA